MSLLTARRRMKTFQVAAVSGCLTLALAGCGGSDTGAAVTLSFASGLPENLYISEGYADWAGDVEELSDGQVAFDNYYGGSLVPQADVAKAISDGQVELGQFAPNTLPDQFKYTVIDSIPGAATDVGAVIAAYRELYETKPELEAEWTSSGMVPLLVQPVAANILASSKELNSYEDVRGLRVRASGPMLSVMGELGATTVTLPQVEIYEGLQRGVVDGATSLTLPSAASQSFGEVASRIYDVGLPTAGLVVVAMNKSAYDDLPAEVKDAFAEAKENADKAWVDRLMEAGARTCEPLAEQGAELIEWSESQKKALQDASFGKAQEAFKATIPDGDAYWEDWQSLMAAYDGEYGHYDGSDIANCLK